MSTKRTCFIADEDITPLRCEDRKVLQGTEGCEGCEHINAELPEGYLPPEKAGRITDDEGPACVDCGRDDVGLIAKKCYKCRAPKKKDATPAASDRGAAASRAAMGITEDEPEAPLNIVESGPDWEPEPGEPRDYSLLLNVLIVLGCFLWVMLAYWLLGHDFTRGRVLGGSFMAGSVLGGVVVALRGLKP